MMPEQAYSYMRFSSPEQSKGDSIRRQTALRDSWLARNNIKLDESLTFKDEGISGFSGQHHNDDRNALAAFLKAVEQGKVKKGSYLIIENLDRLSRESIVPAMSLFLNILSAGIKIVQLHPEQVFNSKSDPFDLMRAILELSRGNSESEMKRVRGKATWDNKRQNAKDKPLTNKLPAWIKNDKDTLVLIADKAEVVRRIFKMARDGNGVQLIANTFNKEQVPTLTGRKKTWSESTVYEILKSPSVYGLYQPCTCIPLPCAGDSTRTRKTRVPQGDPIQGYYPAVISETEFYATKQALQSRQRKGGRRGKHINFFAGLMFDARDGGPIYAMHGKERHSYVPLNCKRGFVKWSSFPIHILDAAILSQLQEIKPAEILEQEEASQVQALQAQLSEVEQRLTKLKAAMLTGDVEELVEVVRTLSQKRQAILEALEEEQSKKASPMSEVWGSVKSLITLATDEESKGRLKQAIGRIVQEVRCLFMDLDGYQRLAFIRVSFVGGAFREYVIEYRPEKRNSHPGYCEPESWEVDNFRAETKEGYPETMDITNPENAERLEDWFFAMRGKKRKK